MDATTPSLFEKTVLKLMASLTVPIKFLQITILFFSYFKKTKGTTIYIPLTFYKMRYGGISSKKLFLKMREDYKAIRRNRAGGIITLICKNLSKFEQFLNF